MTSNKFQISIRQLADKYLTQRNIGSLAILLILLLAAFLRLYNISGYMTFLGDEGRDVLVVKHILEGKFTLLGPTASVGGFFLGPIYYYFMTPFLWLFNYNPVGPAVMVALFGVATVFLIYKVGSEFFGEKAGLIAALFYSTSPLAIAYSRSSWNPNLMPFFSLLSLYCVYKGIEKKKLLFVFLSGLFSGIALQLHYIELFLIATIILYMLVANFLTEKKLLINQVFSLSIKYFFLFAGFLLGFSPFLAFEVRHGFPNLQSILNFIFQSKEVGNNAHYFTIVNDVFFRLFARLVTNFPPPEQVTIGSDLSLSLWYSATLIIALLGIFLLLSGFIKNISGVKKESLQYLLIIFWFFVGVFLFGIYKKSIYDYYFEFMFPLPFLITANLIGNFLNKGIILKLLGVVVFLWILVINLWGIPFRYSPNEQLKQVEKISRFVFDKAEKKPFNFALITGGNSDHAYR